MQALLISLLKGVVVMPLAVDDKLDIWVMLKTLQQMCIRYLHVAS